MCTSRSHRPANSRFSGCSSRRKFVETAEQAATVVDHYRARWVIEEYFKALKTGCAIEKRQLMTYEGLTRALAIFVPMAWHLLALHPVFGRANSPPGAANAYFRSTAGTLRPLC